MRLYETVHALFLLLGTCTSFGAVLLNSIILAEVRRRHLKLVAIWLVPATGSATIALILFVISDLRLLLGLRETLTYYLFSTGLTSLSYLLTIWATVGVWKMIHKMPDNTPVNPPKAMTNSPGTWPPPPTIPS